MRKERKSNFELCRIICMLLIIMHHCIVHGGSIAMDPCFNKNIATFLVPGGKICFNAFLALSTWFLVRQDFKSERFLKIWLEILFYSVTFAVIAFRMGIPMGGRNWFSIFFPITGNSHGFASAYLALYLLIPFLKKVSENITQKQTVYLLLLLFLMQVISQIIGNITLYLQPLNSELLLFIFCYYLSFYLYKWPFKLFGNKLFLLSGVFICWIFLFLIRYHCNIYPESQILGFFMGITGDESSIFNLIGGYMLFLFFNSMEMKTVPIINYLAIPTFGILLIHDHNFFRPVVWNVIFNTSTWYYEPYFLLRVIFVSGLIYVICGVIDFIRIFTLEKLIFKSSKIKSACIGFDKIINNSTDSC